MAREVTVGADGLATGVSYIDTKTGTRPARERAQSSCWRRARSSPCASCSTRGRRSFRRGSPTQAGCWASTSPTRRAPTSAGSFPTSSTCRWRTRTASGAVHLYMPWWLDNKKLGFPRGYHIETWGGRGQPGARLHGRHPALSGGRRVRRGAQERLSQVLGLDDRFLRPRRDDPQRRLLSASSTRRSRTSTASRCCAFTGSGPTPSTTR